MGERVRLSFRKAMLIYTLIPIVLIFAVLSINNLVTTSNAAQQQIEQHMTDLAISYAGIFDAFLRPIESAAKINAILIEESELLTPERIYHLLELQVANNANIYGAAIAFAPGMFDSKQKLFAPYVYRKQGELKRIDIAASGYDYSDGNWEWWSVPTTTGQAGWTEPYFDEGGGNILMTTYSVPFFKNGKIWGVATVDIHLHEISDQINIPGVKSHEITVLSETGKIILFHDKSHIGYSVYDVIKERFENALMLAGDVDSERIAEVKDKMTDYVQQMLDGRTGMLNLEYFDLDGGYWSFFAPIESLGWSFSIRVKEEEIFASAYRHFWHTLILFAISLLLIISSVVLVSGKFSRAFERVVKRCQRIERLNFQQAHTKKIKIEEIKQLWHTLNNMCQALDSHFSLKEDIRIAESIRQHSVFGKEIKISGYQYKTLSNAGIGNSREIVDAFSFGGLDKVNGYNSDSNQQLALLFLDDTNQGLDAAIKSGHLRAIFRNMVKRGFGISEIAKDLNDYLYLDMGLNGIVQSCIATLDSKRGILHYAAFGQLVLLHYSKQRQDCTLVHINPYALAAHETLAGMLTSEIELKHGDCCVLVSDGVIGALDEQRHPFGVARIIQKIEQMNQENAERIAESIQSSLSEHLAETEQLMQQSIVVIKRNI